MIEALEKTLTSHSIVTAIRIEATAAGDEFPFYTNGDDMECIENMYFFMHSGDKFISPYVEKYLKMADTVGQAVLYMAKDFWFTYRQQLYRQWDNFTKEYDPLDNYHVHEVTDYDHSGNGLRADRGTDKVKRSGSIEESGKITSLNSTYPYNSTATAVNHDKSVVEKGENGSSLPTTTFRDVEDTKTYGRDITNRESSSDDLTTDKTGNLGVASASQLLQMDIELWKRNFFTTIFFPLLDKVLTLSIY